MSKKEISSKEDLIKKKIKCREINGEWLLKGNYGEKWGKWEKIGKMGKMGKN